MGGAGLKIIPVQRFTINRKRKRQIYKECQSVIEMFSET